MTDHFRMTLAQTARIAGDPTRNAATARAAWQAGREAGADLVALPEMALTGAARPTTALAGEAMRMVERLAAECAEGPALAIGGPHAEGGRFFNAYWICKGGRITARVLKHLLSRDPDLGERQMFEAGPIPGPVAIGSVRIGVAIGTDAWTEDVAEAQAESGAEILLVPASSPYGRGVHDLRVSHMVARVVEAGLPLAHLNAIGGEGDVIFDGASFVLNPGGALAAQLGFCAEEVVHVDFTRNDRGWSAVPGRRASLPAPAEAAYRAMVERVRGRFAALGAQGAVLGLTGRPGEALVAAIAADALGTEALRCVSLSPDATGVARVEPDEIARRLSCRVQEVVLDTPIRSMRAALCDRDRRGDDEMLARLRGLALLSMSHGALPLVATSKTETLLNAASIMGADGAYNPIGDVWGTHIAGICRWRNAHPRPWMKNPEAEIIPPAALERLDPVDLEDGAPPLDPEVVDTVLRRLTEAGFVEDAVVPGAHPTESVRRISRRMNGREREPHVAAPRLSFRDPS